MRHLKPYKLFESFDEESELISILNDMVLDIKDKDLRVLIYLVNNKMYEETDDCDIEVVIQTPAKQIPRQRFFLKKVYNEIFQIVDFMNSNGWDIFYSSAVTFGACRAYIEDGKIVGKGSGESWEITTPITEFKIRFTKAGK